MARSLYRKLGIGVGVFLTLVAALGLTIYIGGQPLVMRVVFLLKVTTNPLLLLNEAATPAKQIPYGPEPLQFGELRVPDGPGKHPVAILVHGGCWEADLEPGLARWTAGFRAGQIGVSRITPSDGLGIDTRRHCNMEYRIPSIGQSWWWPAGDP